MSVSSSIENNRIYSDALAFAQRYHPESSHLIFVSDLSCKLFDSLSPLHGLGEKEREMLAMAAILHDIGLSRGVKRHHKESMDIILNAGENLKLPPISRQIIALTARYHRHAVPKTTHAVYCNLNKKEREIVDIISSLLRIADALDRRHLQVIDLSKVSMYESIVILYLLSYLDNCLDEVNALNKKKDLFVRSFKKDLEIRLNITDAKSK